ncbi:MAG TPA: hypothetical protein VK090_04830, partial [Paracoccaceae bacterium]|nr:hypothetical protein [Paracoccaceae bacterium]
NYIIGYRGGDCFLSRPIELGPQLARVEIFAPESRVQSVIDFDTAFKRTMGFEAEIGMRPISSAQCPLIQTLDQMPAGTLDEGMIIQLDRDEILSGEELAGRIRGGEGTRLFLHDDDGGQADLSPYMQMAGDDAEFAVPITGGGPQLLIAARPVEGGSLDHVMGLGALLDAAGQGEAALSVGFFLVK